MARLLAGLAPRISRGGPVYDHIAVWPGDLTPSGASVPLRLAAGLHRLVLGDDSALAAVYPPHEADEGVLVAAVEAAFARHAAFFEIWLTSPPQTNEVRRSSVLIAAARWLALRHPLPLRLTELGASAGLNLAFDHYALESPAGRLGAPDSALVLSPTLSGALPPPGPITVAERRGVDLRPMDIRDTEDRLRLLAYLWADQPERRALTEVALGLSGAAGVALDAADVADWLPARLHTPRPGTLHLIYHTVAWQYFPPATADTCRRAIARAGSAATEDTPLAWLGMEADGGTGAALTLRLWPGNETHALGRADFHGRWIDWAPVRVQDGV